MACIFGILALTGEPKLWVLWLVISVAFIGVSISGADEIAQSPNCRAFDTLLVFYSNTPTTIATQDRLLKTHEEVAKFKSYFDFLAGHGKHIRIDLTPLQIDALIDIDEFCKYDQGSYRLFIMVPSTGFSDAKFRGMDMQSFDNIGNIYLWDNDNPFQAFAGGGSSYSILFGICPGFQRCSLGICADGLVMTHEWWHNMDLFFRRSFAAPPLLDHHRFCENIETLLSWDADAFLPMTPQDVRDYCKSVEGLESVPYGNTPDGAWICDVGMMIMLGQITPEQWFGLKQGHMIYRSPGTELIPLYTTIALEDQKDIYAGVTLVDGTGVSIPDATVKVINLPGQPVLEYHPFPECQTSHTRYGTPLDGMYGRFFAVSDLGSMDEILFEATSPDTGILTARTKLIHCSYNGPPYRGIGGDFRAFNPPLLIDGKLNGSATSFARIINPDPSIPCEGWFGVWWPEPREIVGVDAWPSGDVKGGKYLATHYVIQYWDPGCHGWVDIPGTETKNNSKPHIRHIFPPVTANKVRIYIYNETSDSKGEFLPVCMEFEPIYEFPPWDVNKDGEVDIRDIVLTAQHFGESIEMPKEPNPDVNGDRTVNILDITLIGKHFDGNHSQR